MFISDRQICNFAYDNTLHACASTIEEVSIKHEKILPKLYLGLNLTHLQLINPAKFQIMFLECVLLLTISLSRHLVR